MPTTESTDYYDILKVRRDATDDEIKKSYRKLARELHPDANGGDSKAEAEFKKVTVAYETLRDPEKRRQYDMFGANGGQNFSGDPFSGGFGDIFDAFLGGNPFGGRSSRRRGGPPPGEDMETILDLTFPEAVFGASKSFVNRAPEPCDACEATGAKKGTFPVTCTVCNGTGTERRVRQTLLGQMVSETQCSACRGLGKMISDPCPICRGEGRKSGKQELKVEIPAGVDNGVTLRLTGKGAAGPRGGQRGDLYVHLRVAPDKRFSRDGYDLIHELHIPVTQAILGANIELETLDGTEHIAIPAGTQPNTTIRIKQKGVPQVRGARRGDLIVKVMVDIPTKLPKNQDAMVRKLAAERGEVVGDTDQGLMSKLKSALT